MITLFDRNKYFTLNKSVIIFIEASDSVFILFSFTTPPLHPYTLKLFSSIFLKINTDDTKREKTKQNEKKK